MRELKFRAWDGVCFRFFDIRENCDCDFSDFYLGLGKETPIEQYTGLKDKNGKEIYEGDLVLDTYYDDNERYIVKWYNDAVVFGMQSLEDADDYKLPLESLEVIGNIHENPELLEEK